MSTNVPIVDLAPSFSGDDGAARAVARAIDEAYRRLGFMYVVGHSVPEAVIQAAFAASRAFHALPDEAKRAVAMNEWHRGYMGYATSRIVTSRVAKATRPNMSESFMVMHEVAADDPAYLAGKPLQGPNLWPAEPPGFREAILAYVRDLQGLARHLTGLFELALGLEAGRLAPMFARPTTFLRLLHYPPLPESAPEDEFGATPHTDYGFVTLLAQDEIGGLQVQLDGKRWVPAPPVANSFVVNIADMCERLSNGRWRSTRHRVINRAGRDRYSIPFFYDMDMEAEVAPLPECIDENATAAWDPVFYGEYLMARLDANYVYRGGAGGEARAD